MRLRSRRHSSTRPTACSRSSFGYGLFLGTDSILSLKDGASTIPRTVQASQRITSGFRWIEAKLGRPRKLPQEVVGRILEASLNGEGWSSIARGLNAEAIPTAHGGIRWHPSTVRSVVMRQIRA
ncbi:MAG TPA: recombinase family protein [Acidimicrobiales bacterium]|nr:recombinase family protein [Acidimicrobiales bacterium]